MLPIVLIFSYQVSNDALSSFLNEKPHSKSPFEHDPPFFPGVKSQAAFRMRDTLLWSFGGRQP